MISFRDVYFTLTAVNFLAFCIGGFLLGGDAVNGHSGGGHYYLCSHGSCHEVSRAIFTYSYSHAMSVLVTFFALIVASVYEKRFASKIQIGTDESIQEKSWRPSTILRIVNAAFWVTSLIFVAYSDNAFGNAPRLICESAVIAVLWFLVDRLVRPAAA